MATSSIFQTSWIDLVFENRNKDYGAYQLRKDSAKTTFLALISGSILIVGVISLPLLIDAIFGKNKIVVFAPTSPTLGTPVNIDPRIPKLPKKAFVPPVKAQQKTAPQEVGTITKPILVEAAQATKPVLTNQENPAISSPSTSSNGTENGQANIPSFGNGTENNPTHNPNEVANTNALDKKPEFPGGIKNFLAYVGKNYRTPEVELEQTMKVYVSFIVEIDGSMSNIEVKNDPGYGMGTEAIRVLKSIKTKWEAGQIDGQKVRAFYNLPISIELK